MILLIGSAQATDVPFVFDENSSGVADYTSDQIEQAHISSPELADVPTVTQVADDDVLDFPITGGDNTPTGTTEKKVSNLKFEFDARVEPENSRVNEEAVVLALKYPGDLTIDQIASIYSYMKNGDDSKDGWGYVRDPRGIDYIRYANASLKLGDRANCVGGGDCDDFAILMAALVESVGGTTRIILARNNSTGGHAYTEVYLGQIGDQNSPVEDIISWLKQSYETDKIYAHIDTATKDVWLNLDWGPDEKGNTHPGGPFYQGDKHIVLCIRDMFAKTSLKLPEKSNKPPKLVSLISDKPTPLDAGTAVTWIANATDPDGDPILYRFFLNNEPKTDWQTPSEWTWTASEAGSYQAEVQVKDGKHGGKNATDDRISVGFEIIEHIVRFTQAYSVQQTSDGGYITAGSIEGARTDDAWLLKTNSSGNEEWNRRFVLSPGGLDEEDIFNSVKQTSDGGYIITGYSRSWYGEGFKNIWLIKTDNKGNTLWDRTFENGGGQSVKQTSDGGYIIAGDKFGKSEVFWLHKTDSSGDEEWDRTFDFSGSAYHYAYANSVEQTNDGGYIIAGLCMVDNGTEGDNRGDDAWLVKTDSSGNKEWDRTFDMSDWDEAHSVQQTNDGGYIIAGETGSHSLSDRGGIIPDTLDAWLIKTDSMGNKKWDRTFQGPKSDSETTQSQADYDEAVSGRVQVGVNKNDEARSVQQTSDGGYIITGITGHFVWLIKTDADGSKLWDKTFEDSVDGGWSVQQTSDGGYIIAGDTLIKTDANGNKLWDRCFRLMDKESESDFLEGIYTPLLESV